MNCSLSLRKVLIVLSTLIASTTTFASEPPKSSEGAIRPSPEHPRFWEYRGKPIVLLGGSIEDNLFQIADLREHLDLLRSVGGNYVRNTLSSRDRGNLWPFAKRDDGKYDLNQPNEEYWKRFETLLRLAKERDVIVQIELWDRFDFAQEPWKLNPYNPANNVNYTTAQSKLKPVYPRHPGNNDNRFFHSVPKLDSNQVVLKHQQAQVDRMLSISLAYPNVLYCMDNETSGSPEWGAYWATYLQNKARAAKVNVQTTEMWDPWDLSASAHRHTWQHPELYSFVEVSQNNHQKKQAHWDNLQRHRRRLADRPRPMNSVKVYGADGGRFGNDRDGTERFWRNLIGGVAAVRFHRPDSGLGLNKKAQAHLRAARMVADRVALPRCEPANELLSDREANEAYVTAERGKAYVVYFPDGGSVGLDVSAARANLQLSWIDVETGKTEKRDPISPKKRVMLTAPGRGHRVALLTTVTK